MILECACGKMYRVKDDAANPPTKCPACGGALRAAAAAAPSGVVDPRLKDLESKLQATERERTAAKARVQNLEHDLHEAQASIARLGTDLEKAQNSYKDALKKKDSEIEEKQKKIAELEGGTRVRGGAQPPAQTMALLKAKDDALQQARERVTQLEEELSAKNDGGASAERVAHLEQELKEAQASIARLGTDLEKAQNSYKDALKKKDAEIEDRQQKLAALEKQGPRGPAAPPGSELQRAQARVSQLERIVQDGEQRYRGLQEKLERVQQGGSVDVKSHADALAEKDKIIADLRDTLTSEKSLIGQLEKQVQEARKAPKPSAAAPAAVPARLGEARYLAADLDKSLGSVGSALQALVDRVKRLNDSLQNAEAPAEAPAAVPSWGGKAPEPAVEETAFTAEPDAEPAPAASTEEPALADAPTEDIASLESLPEPALADDGLPADETLLDMGKVHHNKPKVSYRRRNSRQETFEPPEGLEEPAPQPADEVPLSAETAPGAAPEEGEADSGSDQPKKKGLFGKLFGKKK